MWPCGCARVRGTARTGIGCFGLAAKHGCRGVELLYLKAWGGGVVVGFAVLIGGFDVGEWVRNGEESNDLGHVQFLPFKYPSSDAETL